MFGAKGVLAAASRRLYAMKTRIERKSGRFFERKLAQRPIRGDPQSFMVLGLTRAPAVAARLPELPETRSIHRAGALPRSNNRVLPPNPRSR
jgi:hypothetical protein